MNYVGSPVYMEMPEDLKSRQSEHFYDFKMLLKKNNIQYSDKIIPRANVIKTDNCYIYFSGGVIRWWGISSIVISKIIQKRVNNERIYVICKLQRDKKDSYFIIEVPENYDTNDKRRHNVNTNPEATELILSGEGNFPKNCVVKNENGTDEHMEQDVIQIIQGGQK